MTDPEHNSFHTLPNQEELDPESWHEEGDEDRQPYLQQPRYGSSRSAHQQTSGQRSGAAHTRWSMTQPWSEILPSATTWMDLEGAVLSEISQEEKANAI